MSNDECAENKVKALAARNKTALTEGAPEKGTVVFASSFLWCFAFSRTYFPSITRITDAGLEISVLTFIYWVKAAHEVFVISRSYRYLFTAACS